MSTSSNQNQRKNYHLEYPSPSQESPPPTRIHIFSKNKNSPIICSVCDELRKKGYSFQIHQNSNQISQVIGSSTKKIIILVDSSKENNHQPETVFSKYYKFPPSTDNMKFFTLPNKIKDSKLHNLSTLKDLTDYCAKYFTDEGYRRIKLASVHAIKGSRDNKIQTSKSLKKIMIDSTYDQLYYFKDDDNDYGEVNDTLTYMQFLEVLQKEQKYEMVKHYKDLERKGEPKNHQKHLLIASTNQKSIKIVQKMRKQKNKNFDIMLLGDLNPNQYMLDQNVILASNDVIQHANFLIENGFQSYRLRTLITTYTQKRITDLQRMNRQPTIKSTDFDSNKDIVPPIQTAGDLTNKGKMISNNSNGNTLNYYTSVQALPSKLSTANDDKHNNEEKSNHDQKKKIKKIKSPAKSKVVSQQPQKQADINIIVSKHDHSIIKETDQYTTNKQGQKIIKNQQAEQSARVNYTKPESNKAINSMNEQVYYQQNRNKPYSSAYDARAPNTAQTHFLKKSIGFQSKYRNNPSTIIHEMSDEYRGSNKQSIMNLQPQNSIKSSALKNNPIAYSFGGYEGIKDLSQQEGSNKKIISNAISYSNYPESYYNKSSQKIIEQNKNNNVIYTAPRIIPATTLNYNTSQGTTTTTTGSVYQVGQVGGIRTYGRVNAQTYQSPSRVVRKQQLTGPEQIKNNDSSRNLNDNRLTFGSNAQIPNSNTSLAYTQQSMQSPKTNYPTYNNSNYYNVQTSNYHKINNEPYNNKIEISVGKINDINGNSSDKHIEVTHNEINNGGASTSYDVNKYANRYMSPPKIDVKTTRTIINNTGINLDQYERIERNGQIMYKKKVQVEIPKKQTIIGRTEAYTTNDQQGSPTVKRYQTSPLRSGGQINNQYSPSDYNTYNRYQTVTDYKRNENTPTSNYETYNINLKGDQYNGVNGTGLGEMIQSSHKKNNNQDKFVGVSYNNRSNDQKWSSGYFGTRVYGVNQPRIDVERVERLQPKVQACHPNTRSPNSNPMNESNWFSRMSQLHSDGSILRRNNIRFGINLKKKQQRLQDPSVVSVMQNKLASGLFKVNDLNKKMAMNRIIQGQEYLQQQRDKYIHINTKFNSFHFLIHEDMNYLNNLIQNYITSPNDKIQNFTGSEQLLQCIKSQKIQDKFDVGFIFLRKEQAVCINTKLFPQDYFIVIIQGEDEPMLQINQMTKIIKMDQLRHLSLAQKIIVDSQLYQYVAYRNNKKDIQQLADKFMNSQFILQKIETQFNSQILDCYYSQFPSLTRLYVLCDQTELPDLLKLITYYEKINPGFQQGSCKLVCLISNILKNDQLIMNHPTVTFISNPEQIIRYKDILKYAHHADDDCPRFLPIDHIFYHHKHGDLDKKIEMEFPGRFLIVPYSKIAEVYSKIERVAKVNAKYGYKLKNYLILHQSVNGQKINMESFAKVYMLGKAKVVQNKVVRVMNSQELLQLLKK